MGSSLGALPEGGRTKQLPASKKCTATCGSCPGSQRVKGQCCDPRVALVPVCVCQSSHHLTMLCALLLTFSKHCCSADFVPPPPQSNHLLLWPSNRPFWRPSCSVWCAFRFPSRWFVPVWMILVVTLVVFRGKKGGGESSATRRWKPGTTTRKNQRATTRGQQPEFYNVGFVVLELTFFSSRTIFASVPDGGEEEPKRTFFHRGQISKRKVPRRAGAKSRGRVHWIATHVIWSTSSGCVLAGITQLFLGCARTWQMGLSDTDWRGTYCGKGTHVQEWEFDVLTHLVSQLIMVVRLSPKWSREVM